MASNNPNVTASNIISDVEARLMTPAISSNTYLPWISYAYGRVFLTLLRARREIAEQFFADSYLLTLNTTNPNEYTLTDYIPRFGGMLKVEILYGATGDTWINAAQLPAISTYDILQNNTTQYRGKSSCIYYLIGGKIGFIPVPPESGATARIYYIKRPYQIDSTSDVIDIPYRYQYPIVDYVQSKAIQTANQDYSTSQILEDRFRQQLEEIAISADSEIVASTNILYQGSALYDNPLS
jgi:hypothetical protein